MTTQDKFIALTRKGEDTRIEYKTCTEEISESLYESVCSLLRYAPLYYPNYKVEINSGSQFIFSITYQDVNTQDGGKMSPSSEENVTKIGKMSPSSEDNVPELTPEELDLSLEPKVMKSAKDKKKRRRQAIVSLMDKDSHISVESISDILDVHKRTILRDIEDLKKNLVIERVGGNYGEWKVIKKKK